MDKISARMGQTDRAGDKGRAVVETKGGRVHGIKMYLISN